MASASPVSDRLPFEDISSLRLTPTPAENYRCPVSTPSNYVQRHGRIRRTKPLQDFYSQPPTAGGRTPRSKRGALSKQSRDGTMAAKSMLRSPKTGSSLEYYYLDKKGNKMEEQQTNTHWLRALCSQPVEEILNKYRRKSDVRRTRNIWSKTFTTPGEKSLLSAWQNSVIRGSGQQAMSAVEGGTSARTRWGSATICRPSQSEPPPSRTHLEDMRFSLSPRSPHKTENSADVDHKTNGEPRDIESKDKALPQNLATPTQRKIPGFLLAQSPRDGNSRIRSYTTQYFTKKGQPQGPVCVKVATGPEQLPRISQHHKVSSMLYNAHYSYKGVSGTSGNPSPRSPDPLIPKGAHGNSKEMPSQEDT